MEEETIVQNQRPTSMRGRLSAYASALLREKEEKAFISAMNNKHESDSNS